MGKCLLSHTFPILSVYLDRDARTLLAKNLPYKVTQDELKEVFEDAVEIRLVSKDGKSKGYVLSMDC